MTFLFQSPANTSSEPGLGRELHLPMAILADTLIIQVSFSLSPEIDPRLAQVQIAVQSGDPDLSLAISEGPNLQSHPIRLYVHSDSCSYPTRWSSYLHF